MIGFIGLQKMARAEIDKYLKSEDQILEIDNNCDVDEIREFRKFLSTRGMRRKVGIINLLNRFSENDSAILLKVIEELPEFNSCFFTASFLPSFVMQTRSQIHYLPMNLEAMPDALEFSKNILEAMKLGLANENLFNAAKIWFYTYSLYVDGCITEAEKNNVIKGL